MQRRNIGSLEVSVVGLGCNNFGWRVGREATHEVLDAALDSGINFLDTADMYGGGQSEEFLGEALGTRRNQVVLATKFGLPMGEGLPAGGRPEYVRQAVEASLRRLKTDRIDLYQYHRPDPETPIADTLGAMEELVRAGKVREIGCSNFSAQQLRESRGRFRSVQNQLSLLHHEPEAEVLAECRRSGIAFIPYYPLAYGLLTGKYRKDQPMPENSRGKDAWGPGLGLFTERNLETVESLIAFASSRGRSLLELAISWLAAQSEVASVIAGAKTAQQVKANAAAAGWGLTEAETAEVSAIVTGY